MADPVSHVKEETRRNGETRFRAVGRSFTYSIDETPKRGNASTVDTHRFQETPFRAVSYYLTNSTAETRQNWETLSLRMLANLRKRRFGPFPIPYTFNQPKTPKWGSTSTEDKRRFGETLFRAVGHSLTHST
jgi:hypothetical protein